MRMRITGRFECYNDIHLLPASAHGKLNQSVENLVMSLVVCLKGFPTTALENIVFASSAPVVRP